MTIPGFILRNALRNKRRLTLTLALSRQKWGKPRPSIHSRFLYELTGQAQNPNYLAAKRGERPHPRSTAQGPHARPAQARPLKRPPR